VTPPPARAKARGDYHHGDLRRELIRAAIELMGSRGEDAFTLREVARHVGVNHRAAYRHFADKQALETAVAIQGFEGLRLAMQRRIRGCTEPAERVERIFRAYVRFALGHPAHYRLMFGPLSRSMDESAELRTAIFAVIAVIEVEAEALLGTRGKPVRDAVIAHWALGHGLCDLMISGHVPYASIARAEDYVLDRMRAGAPLL